MAKESPAQTSFSAGELSPLAAARVDSDQYRNGLKTCINGVTTALGPVVHRPGTVMCATVKDSTKKIRTKRFEFSTEQAYMLEFGDLYIRFYRNNEQITQATQAITAITKANPAVVTYSGSDNFTNGMKVKIKSVAGMEQVNNREFTVANVSTGANTFELPGVNSTAYDTYTSGGTVAQIIELATPYLEADLFELELKQSADVLYISHPSYAPRKLERTSHIQWELVQIAFKDGPYLNTNLTLTTITPSATYYGERANPKNFHLYSVAWSGTQFVAVGNPDGTDAYLITSPDGITWTERSNPKNLALYAIAWSGTQFVAVGNNDATDAYVVTSPDGITWTERANPKNFALWGVAWSGTQFVAVGNPDGTDAYLITSPDGITWTERSNPKNIVLFGVAWSGTQFVAVGQGDGTDSYIVTSPDGITWTERAPTVPKNLTLYEVAWSGTQFVAVGQLDGATDAYIVTSPDGITWTERANPKNFNLWGVAWSGTQFVAFGNSDGTDAYLITSPDGITWTERSNPKNFGLEGGAAWVNDKVIIVGVADGTDAYIVSNDELTLTASNDLFKSTDVGRLVRIKHSTTWGYAKIISYTSGWLVTAVQGNAFGAATASLDWRLGAWSATTGYPGAVTFYEDRLVFGGGDKFPGRIDASKSSNYENFAPTDTTGVVANDNAISFTLNASSVNRIYWLMDDEKGIVAGTPGGCWLMRPSTLGEALTPTNVSAKRFTAFGAKDMQSLRAGRSTLYVQREGRVLREISASGSREGLGTKDISLASSHITKTGLTELAYQQYPHEVVWAVRTDGILTGNTYSLAESDETAVHGWHRHTLGGVFGSGNAVVESVDVIPSADGTYEQLWLAVKRTINGSTVRTVEYMKNFFESDVDVIADAYFVDCGLTYSGSSTSTIGSLFHLEGQTVTVLADGLEHANKTVSNGKITLDRAATKVHVGLYSNADGETLRFEAGARDGTAQGKTQRINRVVYRFDNTQGMKHGPNFTSLDLLPFETTALFTGDIGASFSGGYGTEQRICFRQTLPLPYTLLAIYPQIVTQDRG